MRLKVKAAEERMNRKWSKYWDAEAVTENGRNDDRKGNTDGPSSVGKSRDQLILLSVNNDNRVITKPENCT